MTINSLDPDHDNLFDKISTSSLSSEYRKSADFSTLSQSTPATLSRSEKHS